MTFSSTRSSPALVLLMAVSTGLVVANLYYAQPLLAAIAISFHSSVQGAGLIVTITQLGYAAGLLLVVPLGDIVDRKRLIVLILLASTVALGVAAVAPGLLAFTLACVLVGLGSVAAQVLVPFAASLAGDSERGRVVGTVMSGLLLGILLARTLAGVVATLAGWRAIYLVAAGLMLGLAGVLWRTLPDDPKPRATISYEALIASVFQLARQEPVLRLRSLYGALGFAAFSIFWTSLAFLLSKPPFGYSEGVIGLFGLVGAAGAVAAAWAGRLADRGRSRTSTVAFAVLILMSFLPVALGAKSLLALIVGVIVLDLGVQGLHITNQSEVYQLRPEFRSRITTVYLTTYFIGGALGSSLSAELYARFGWAGVSLAGAACGAGILIVWGLERVRNLGRA